MTTDFGFTCSKCDPGSKLSSAASPQELKADGRGRKTAEINKTLSKVFADSISAELHDVLCMLGWWRGRRPTLVSRELNRRGIPAPKGGEWHPITASRLMKRLPQIVEGAWRTSDLERTATAKSLGYEP